MLVILAVVFEVVFCCTCDGGHGNLDGQDNDAHQMNQSDRGSLMTNYIYNYEYIYIYIYIHIIYIYIYIIYIYLYYIIYM